MVVGALSRRDRRRPTGTEERSLAHLGLALVQGVSLALLALAGVPVYFAGRTESLLWAPRGRP